MSSTTSSSFASFGLNTPSQALSTPLSFKNTHNARTQAIFFLADDDASSMSLHDVDVDTQRSSSADEPPVGYGRKIANAVLCILLAIKSFGRMFIRH